MWSIQPYLKDMISLQWIHVIYNYIYKYDQRCIQLYDELGWYLYRAHKIKLDCILSWGLSMGSAHLLQWLVIRHFQRAVTVVLFYSFFGEGWRLDLLQDLAQFSHWEIPLFGESMLRCFFFCWVLLRNSKIGRFFREQMPSENAQFCRLRGPGERGIVQSGGLFVRWKPQGFGAGFHGEDRFASASSGKLLLLWSPNSCDGYLGRVPIRKWFIIQIYCWVTLWLFNIAMV